MKILDLRSGITDNDVYKAFKFHGGEVHFLLKNPTDFYSEDAIRIVSRITNSDELMLLILVIDTIRKDEFLGKLEVFIPYMPYQQADRDFSLGECFSLQTITKILNSLEVDKFHVFDAHSDVTPVLLKKCSNIDVSDTIKTVLLDIQFKKFGPVAKDDTQLINSLTILSPDSGAYKKVGKLCSKINWKGDLVAANKYRSISSGNIESLELSKDDFEGKDVLIIDDIMIYGNTFVRLAEKLKEKNVGKLYLYVSHTILEKPSEKIFTLFDTVYTANTRGLNLNDNFKIIDFIK